MKRRSFISKIGYSICATYLTGLYSCSKRPEEILPSLHPLPPLNPQSLSPTSPNSSKRIDSIILFDDFNSGTLSVAWTVSGSAPSLVSGTYLQLTGRNTDDKIINSASTLSKKFVYEIKAKISRVDDSYFMFGMEWATGNILAQVHFSDLSGMWQLVNTAGAMGSVPGQSVSDGDEIILRIIRNDYDFTYEIENLTKQNKHFVVYTYNEIIAASPFTLPRETSFFLKPFSGTIDIDWVRVKNEEYMNADVMLIGQSIMDGCDAGSASNTILEKLRIANPAKVYNLFAEAASTTALMSTHLQDIIDLAPRNAVIMMGTNDLLAGFPPDSFITDLKFLVESLENSSISIKVCNVPPVDAGNAEAVKIYNAAMNNEPAFSGKVIDIYSDLKGPNGELVLTTDGFHPTAPGLAKIFEKINSLT